MKGAALQEHVLAPGTANGAIWRYSRAHPKLPHFHGQLEFLLIRRGSVVERIGRIPHRACAGQLLWHLPGIEHEQLYASPDLDLRVVHVEPDHVPAVTERSDGVARPRPAGSFAHFAAGLGRCTAGRPVVELARRDLDTIDDVCDATSHDLGLHVDVTARLHRALEVATSATLRDHDDRCPSSLVQLSCARLLEDPSLGRADIARELDVSEGYLARRFQAELGASFTEQRTRLRLSHFATRVTRLRESLLDAALASGFGSYSQLHRELERHVGMGAREYFHGGGRNRLARVPA